MGQGTNTAMAMLVAEELGVDWGHIAIRPIVVRPIYTNPAFGMLKTGASLSVKGRYLQLRQLGASARIMLERAAADRLKVSPSDCHGAGGAVQCPGGKRIPYGELIDAAAALPVPQDVPLKPKSAWTILGKSQPRIDMVDKCTGNARCRGR